MIKILLRFFPPIALALMAFASYMALHLLAIKKIISFEIFSVLLPSIMIMSLLLMGVRTLLSKSKKYESVIPSKIYVNICKILLGLIIAMYILAYFIIVDK